jgi:cytochrome c oxidase assembly factor CtaG
VGRMQGCIQMSKITLLAAAAAVLMLIGIETWLSVRTLAPTGPLAGSTVNPLIMTSAKGLPTSRHHDHHVFD